MIVKSANFSEWDEKKPPPSAGAESPHATALKVGDLEERLGDEWRG